MNQILHHNMKPIQRRLTAAEIEAFGQRIEALREATVAKLGIEDAEYIHSLLNFVRYSEITSRTALMFGGWIPPIWLAATATLAMSKIIENMEIGHNVLHGQYDWLNDPTLRGATYDWDMATAPTDWKRSHNYEHHTYTNILGKDHDVGWGVFRLFKEQAWEPRFLANVPIAVILFITFQYPMGMQTLRLGEWVDGKITREEVLVGAEDFIKKATRQLLKDYVFFPVIAGPMFLPVLTGNLTANVIRNMWVFVSILVGHTTENVVLFEDNLGSETKAEWYYRQLMSSSNITGSKWFHMTTGNLSNQIEHHLFPDIPANRYHGMSSEVQAICAEFGLHYNTGNMRKQLGSVIKRLVVYSFPDELVKKVQDRFFRGKPFMI